jgi:hypothetical protein
MFPIIVSNNPQLCTYVDHLSLHLSAPQRCHVVNVADSILVTDGPKTLAALMRHCLTAPDVSNVADTFRIAPWEASTIREPVATEAVRTALTHLDTLNEPRFLLVNIDDSLAIKDPDTRHLEGVDWYFDHAASRRQRAPYQNALCSIDVTLVAGDHSFTFDVQPYLNKKTVRRLNRTRQGRKRLHFRSKYRIVRAILERLVPLIPKAVRVYVLCDSWYAAARLIKYVRRQNWHIICRVKANRRLDKQPLSARDAAQRHQRCSRVTTTAADGTATIYLVRSMIGHLRGVPFPVCALVSRRHYRDHCPVYFVSTDLSLSPQATLGHYSKRWASEVENWYHHERVGLGDFRVQSFEAIMKYWAVVLLAWGYVQRRAVQEPGNRTYTPADIMRRHRLEHARQMLVAFGREVLATGDIDAAVQRFLADTS